MTLEIYKQEDLDSIIDNLTNESEISIWVAIENIKFPCMNIIIKGKLAYIHYFSSENHAGYQSIGDSDYDDNIVINVEENVVVPRYCLLDINSARKVCKEFLKNHSLPALIKWYEL